MSQRRVLVIDDAELARESVRLVLEEAGYAVSTLPSPIGAGSAISEERPDLILLDVNMPQMDGPRFLELAARDDFFRDFFEGIPVVLFSERPTAELEALRSRLNAAGAVSKGVPSIELLARVERWIGGGGVA